MGEHLQIGRIRMVSVADVVPPELQRIVEFLNEGMTRAQVYAVRNRSSGRPMVVARGSPIDWRDRLGDVPARP